MNTPYGEHGALSVDGMNLVDAAGKPFQLKGVSTHGIAWFPDYVSKAAFQTLRDDWGANVIRLAMYTEEYNGYCTVDNSGKKQLRDLVDTGVQAAAELGIYVIIDWHILSDGNPLTHQNEAVAFFSEMSEKYKDYGNVLYEICNEPNGGTTWQDITSYADTVIPVIRANAPKAVILVGTPTWSQEVTHAYDQPLAYDNIMYTMHFYAATHKDKLRRELQKALDEKVPVFLSEFSICDASGSGSIDTASGDAWFDLIRKYNLSFCGWNLSNKNESSSVLLPTCRKLSGWSVSDLSETGKYLRDRCRE